MGNPVRGGGVERSAYTTVFGSLDNFDKGAVELINDDARHYAFSNVFDVASKSKPWEKVAVAKNFEYVLEAIRAEGQSAWRAAARLRPVSRATSDSVSLGWSAEKARMTEIPRARD